MAHKGPAVPHRTLRSIALEKGAAPAGLMPELPGDPSAPGLPVPTYAESGPHVVEDAGAKFDKEPFEVKE